MTCPRAAPNLCSGPDADDRGDLERHRATEPFKSFDFVENYLRTIFGFVGITDMRFFNVQPMDVSMDLRRTAQRAAIGEVREYAASGEWRCGPDAAASVPDLAGVKPARMAVA
jgi:Flavodoxin-like fold